MPILDTAEVRIWWGAHHDLAPERRAFHWGVLSGDEQASVGRFAFAIDRQQSFFSRTLVRHALTEVSGCLHPSAWQFRRTPLGRPLVVNPGFESLTFSLSHTRRLVACAVTVGAELGIDVEGLSPRVPVEVAERYFSRAEAADLELLEPDRRGRRFLEYWTLKEAFLNARGLGLRAPLDSFSFRLGEHDAQIVFSREMTATGEDPARWHFMRGEIALEHLFALAYGGRGGRATPKVTFRAARSLLGSEGGPHSSGTLLP